MSHVVYETPRHYVLLLVKKGRFISKTHGTGGSWPQPVIVWLNICSSIFLPVWICHWKHFCPLPLQKYCGCQELKKNPPIHIHSRSFALLQPSNTGRGRSRSASNYRKTLRRGTRLDTEHKIFSSHDSWITSHSRTDSRQQHTPLWHFQPSHSSQQTLVLAQIWWVYFISSLCQIMKHTKLQKKDRKSDVTFLPSTEVTYKELEPNPWKTGINISSFPINFSFH